MTNCCKRPIANQDSGQLRCSEKITAHNETKMQSVKAEAQEVGGRAGEIKNNLVCSEFPAHVEPTIQSARQSRSVCHEELCLATEIPVITPKRTPAQAYRTISHAWLKTVSYYSLDWTISHAWLKTVSYYSLDWHTFQRYVN